MQSEFQVLDLNYLVIILFTTSILLLFGQIMKMRVFVGINVRNPHPREAGRARGSIHRPRVRDSAARRPLSHPRVRAGSSSGAAAYTRYCNYTSAKIASAKLEIRSRARATCII